MTENSITAREEAVAGLRILAAGRAREAEHIEQVAGGTRAARHQSEIAALLEMAATMLEERLDEKPESAAAEEIEPGFFVLAPQVYDVHMVPLGKKEGRPSFDELRFRGDLLGVDFEGSNSATTHATLRFKMHIPERKS